MSLELGEGYKQFYGDVSLQMHRLLDEKYTPVSMADVMLRRLQLLPHLGSVKYAWLDRPTTTGDMVLVHPDHKVKFVHGTEDVWRRILYYSYDQKENLPDYFKLEPGIYESIDAEEFGLDYLPTHFHTPQEVADSLVWKFFGAGRKVRVKKAKGFLETLFGNDSSPDYEDIPLEKAYASAFFPIARNFYNAAPKAYKHTDFIKTRFMNITLPPYDPEPVFGFCTIETDRSLLQVPHGFAGDYIISVSEVHSKREHIDHLVGIAQRSQQREVSNRPLEARLR